MASQLPTVVTVYFHEEDGGGWSADSPDAPGYMAYADTLDECRVRAQEGLRFFLDRPVAIYDPTVNLRSAGGAELGGFGGTLRRVAGWVVDDPSAGQFRGLPPGVGIPTNHRVPAT